MRYNLFVFSAFLSQACYRSSFPVRAEVNNSHVYIYQHLDQADSGRLASIWLWFQSLFFFFPPPASGGASTTPLQTTCRVERAKNKQKPLRFFLRPVFHMLEGGGVSSERDIPVTVRSAGHLDRRADQSVSSRQSLGRQPGCCLSGPVPPASSLGNH